MLLSTFTVTSLGDDNLGSGLSGDLRYVLNQANALNTGTSTNPDVIDFSGVSLSPTAHTIHVGAGAAGARPLPALTDVAIIDGTSATNFDNLSGLMLTLDGSKLRGHDNGLVLQGGFSTVQGLQISNFPHNGILVTSAFNTIGGDEVGLNINGVPNNPPGRITDQVPTGTTAPVFVRPPLGNVISGNGGDGVRIRGESAQFNLLEGNFIGTDVTGIVAKGNRGNGVSIIDADNNTLLGTTPPDQNNPFVFYNVISGNRGNGLLINNSNSTTVYANFFGLGADNSTPLGNRLDGVLINGTSDQTIFGLNIPLGNVTAANGKHGLEIAGSASRTIAVNTFSGVAAFNPSAQVGNHGDGILVTSNGGGKVFGASAFSTIILTCQTSGNGGNGIEIRGAARGVQISQSVIGMATDGRNPAPNRKDGIAISGKASGVSIGGFEPSVAGIPEGLGFLEAANQISGNQGNGLSIQGRNVRNVRIVNSLIGTQIDGASPAGNGLDGVFITDASNVEIGQTVGTSVPRYRNTIAFNRQNGVEFRRGNQNSILGGPIYGNGALGIALVHHANDRTPAPILTAATTDTATSNTLVTGTLHARASTIYQIEVFASTTPNLGNGQYFLGFSNVQTDLNGVADIAIDGLVNPNPTRAVFITATATSLNETQGPESGVTRPKTHHVRSAPP
ncbi:MAG: right-handed parallel beta-helix repeat-containing protein, partial [Isosphaeraceae bacterium]